MHILQPKQTKLKQEEVDKLLKELNISLSQLPKIRINDVTISEDAKISDVFSIERVDVEGNKTVYYRVVAI